MERGGVNVVCYKLVINLSCINVLDKYSKADTDTDTDNGIPVNRKLRTS